ncbi:hypothetical protein [Halocynthiibacter sp.]|uniref:hypothetical protein n=1 Tax=Halocynthiibacter sp. TaxID=1979210 RepID=UPI003C5DA26D
MTCRIRILVAYLLSALIIMTSGTMAVARGHAMAAGQIVICTGYTMKVIAVDQDNQPIGPVQYCPDCALSFMDMTPITAITAQSPSRVIKLGYFVSAQTEQCQDCIITQQARGPPLSV